MNASVLFLPPMETSRPQARRQDVGVQTVNWLPNNQQPLPLYLISRFPQFTQEWSDAPQSVLEKPCKSRTQQIQEQTYEINYKPNRYAFIHLDFYGD